MIRITALKAMLIGIGVLVLAQVLYVGVLVKINHHEFLRWALLGAPSLAACIASYMSSTRKLLIGTSMALYGTLIGMLSALGYEYFGLPVDYIGDPLAIFPVLLTYYAVLAIVGSVAGIVLSQVMYRHSSQ
jgi:hypothetical protein